MSSAIRNRFTPALAMLIAAAVAVPAAGANARQTPAVSQAKAGGNVLDRSGGYYDPQRSIYVPRGNVVGHYDPQRSIYVPASTRPL